MIIKHEIKRSMTVEERNPCHLFCLKTGAKTTAQQLNNVGAPSFTDMVSHETKKIT